MALTHSVLAPLTAAIGRAHGRFGQSRHYPLYPQPVAARVIGTAGNAALSRSPAVVDPYVTYASVYTGRFAGRHYPRPRLGTVQWKGRWAGPRLGQNVFTDLYNAGVNAAENLAGGLPINAPNAGGGSVTVGGVTQYVNAQGEDQSTLDPTAGQTPGQQLQQAATDAGSGTLLIVAGIAAVGLFFLFKK